MSSIKNRYAYSTAEEIQLNFEVHTLDNINSAMLINNADVYGAFYTSFSIFIMAKTWAETELERRYVAIFFPISRINTTEYFVYCVKRSVWREIRICKVLNPHFKSSLNWNLLNLNASDDHHRRFIRIANYRTNIWA